MKKICQLLVNLILLTVSYQCSAQAVSLGDDENKVYNILYDRVNSYNNSQGNHDIQTFAAVHYNGVVSEIIISIKDGYLIDLRVNSDYAKHYVMKNGVLDHISTQYENLSINQLKNGYNKLYGEKHIEEYYFSNEFKTYKTIFLADDGLATVEERNTYDTQFSPKFNVILYRIGVANKFLALPNKVKNNGMDAFLHTDEKNPYNNVRIHNSLTTAQIQRENPNLRKLLNDLKSHFDTLITRRKGEDNALATTIEYVCFGKTKSGMEFIPKYYCGTITNFKQDSDEYYLFPNSDSVSRHPYNYYLRPYGFDSNPNGFRIFKNKEQTKFNILDLK